MADILRFEEDWEFCFDPVDTGLVDQWYRRKPDHLRKVKLPHLFAYDQNPDNAFIGYYFKDFTFDKKEPAKRFLLRVHAAHPHCMIWLNGQELATRFSGHAGVEVDAGKAFKPGETNLIAIRVQGLDRGGKVQDQPGTELPLGAPHQRGAFAGLLGPVDFVPGIKAVIRSVNVLPDFEADRITIETRFLNSKSFQSDVSFDIVNQAGETSTLVKNVRLDRENSVFILNLQMENSKVWSPADPALYTLKVGVPGTPSVSLRFGMRGVEVDKGTFKINHTGFKVRGVGFPWFFPFHHGLPAFPVDIRKEILALKEAGFNLIRGAGAPLPPSVLDLCDELGLLVLQETSCYNQKSSKEGLDWVKQQIQALVDRDGHHPCIFGWVMGSENGSMVLENGNKLLRFTAELDPTRPVFSNLGSVHLDGQGGGKIDLGKVYEPLVAQISPFEGHKLRLGYPVSQRTYAMVSGYCSSKEGKAIADGIHGNKSFWERYNYLKDEIAGKLLADGLGVPTFGNPVAMLEAAKKFSTAQDYKDLNRFLQELGQGLKDKGLEFWKDPAAFFADADEMARASLVRQIEALLSNPQISGYVIENWADHGLHFSGLADWFRVPKAALLEAMKRVNRPIHVFAEAEERTPYAGSSATIKVHMFNEGHLGEYAIQFRVKGPNGKVWHQESQNAKAKPGVNAVGRFKFPVGFERGRFTFDLTLTRQNREIGKAEEIFFAPPEVKLDSVLKKVSLIGNFPDTVSYSTRDDAAITVVSGVADIPEAALRKALEKASQGGALILGALTEEDTRRLNGFKAFASDIACFRSYGGPQGNFHYLKAGPAFKDLPGPGLMDPAYADVQPLWSLDHIPQAEVHAGSLNITTTTGAKTKIRWGIDLAVAPLGKGKVIFCQYDVFSKLGKNALADALFANLIQQLAK